MSLEMKPHLSEIADLYKKVCDFESSVELIHPYNPVGGAFHYMGRDIENVLEGFSGIFDISREEMELLKKALYDGEKDFMDLIRDEMNMSEKDYRLAYIISRPFFKALRKSVDSGDTSWDEGRCTVCSSTPSLSVIEKESRRKYVCSFCGSVGYYMRLGCPACQTGNSKNISLISIDGEEGVRADVCDDCKSYVKTFDGFMAHEHPIERLDVMSLPLDIIAQDQGYRRYSPNPVGMRRMNE